jgi:hypothetical protein
LTKVLGMPKMRYMNSSKIINELGGTSVVAAMFEIKPSSVSEWRKNGIPKARKQYLQLLRPDIFARETICEGNHLQKTT